MYIVPQKVTEPETGCETGGKRPHDWVSIIKREFGEPVLIKLEYSSKNSIELILEPQELALAKVPRDTTKFPATIWFRDLLFPLYE